MNSDLLKEIKNFYLSVGVFSFATSIIEIFVPLYLLIDKDFSLTSVILFYIAVQFGRIIFLPLSAYLSSRFGAKKIISFAFILSAIFYALLQRIDHSPVIFYSCALIFGAFFAFLWIPYLVHLSKISPNGIRGKIIGRINIFTALARAFGPIFGGIIISVYGFEYGFALVILLIIPSIYLLLSTPEKSKIRKINFRLINIKKIFPDLIANGFYNFQNFLNFLIWPAFIFLIVPYYNQIGFIQTVSLLISIIAFALAGRWTDKFDRKKFLFWSNIFDMLINALRIFANSFASIFLVNIAKNFSWSFRKIPYHAKIYEHMDEEPRTEYVFFLELSGAFFTLFGFLLFVFLIQSLSLKDALLYGIIISAIAGLPVSLLRK
ncbi:MAG: MFS transporter [Candidatus Pacebacteria bacterium]|nr:MFS transporter [Candidatus Paceibacterota bacterium]